MINPAWRRLVLATVFAAAVALGGITIAYPATANADRVWDTDEPQPAEAPPQAVDPNTPNSAQRNIRTGETIKVKATSVPAFGNAEPPPPRPIKDHQCQ
jgi:hypothetical protein